MNNTAASAGRPAIKSTQLVKNTTLKKLIYKGALIMKIKYTNSLWDEVRTLPDSSEILIKYKDNKLSKKTLELIPRSNDGYMCTEGYYLDVHLPRPRELQAVLIIKRSSQNCYKVTYSDSCRAEMQTLTGLNELNNYIAMQESHIKPSAEAKKELSEAQSKFAAAFPDKVIDCEIPPQIDIDIIIQAVKERPFLKQSNITLKSCVKHYKEIVNGGYKPFSATKNNDPGFCVRDYNKEELNAIRTNINDYQV